MQTSAARQLTVIALLLVGNLILPFTSTGRVTDAARWPTDRSTFQIDGWTAGPERVETANGVSHISRTYQRPDGRIVQLVISTAPEAKRVYRAEPDVPFLGNGYLVEPPPPGLVPPSGSRGAFRFSRGGERGLVLYAYGERRGLLGNGPLAWGLVALDGVLALPGDYYLARVILVGPDDASTADAAGLADVLFPQVAAWYGNT